MSTNPSTFPLQEMLGFEIEPGDGRATATLDLDDKHHNPNGVTHGAVPFAMMDTAMGAAVMSVLGEGKICATIEMHTRFHRGAQSGRLIATAEVMHAGRRIVHLEGRTVDADGRLIASATSSYAVIDLNAS